MPEVVEVAYDVVKENKTNVECQELSENYLTKTIWLFKKALHGVQKGRVPHSVKATYEVTYKDELK